MKASFLHSVRLPWRVALAAAIAASLAACSLSQPSITPLASTTLPSSLPPFTPAITSAPSETPPAPTTAIEDLPAGDYIGFSQYGAGGKCIGLFALSPETEAIYSIAVGLCDVAAAPSLHRLAYVEGLDMKVVDLQQGGPQPITTISGCANPSWSPNGTLIACDDSDANIRVFDIMTGLFSVLTDCDYRSGLPCTLPLWSPDGLQIAFQRACGRGGGCGSASAQQGLYILALDCPAGPPACSAQSSGPLPIVYPENCEWAADNRRIACNGTSGIEIADARSGDKSILPRDLCEPGPIAWHPRIDWLACESPVTSAGSTSAIRLIDSQGNSQDIPLSALHFNINFWIILP